MNQHAQQEAKRDISSVNFIVTLTGLEIDTILTVVGVTTSMWAKNRRQMPGSFDLAPLSSGCDKLMKPVEENYQQRCASHSDFQSERDKIICCARCPCKESDCEDFCKHFQPLGNLMAVIKDGDLIESREALEHHFGRHDTCKSERTRCPLCREELRQAGEP
jgi:hypothetical protein